MHYLLKGIRLSRGTNTNEGSTKNEATARQMLASLAVDLDCILAEIDAYPDSGGIGLVPVIAQAERVNGEWRMVEGELRTRAYGGEAEEILRAARAISEG